MGDAKNKGFLKPFKHYRNIILNMLVVVKQLMKRIDVKTLRKIQHLVFYHLTMFQEQ